jgi:chromatin remodeling complex protein RSC6
MGKANNSKSVAQAAAPAAAIEAPVAASKSKKATKDIAAPVVEAVVVAPVVQEAGASSEENDFSNRFTSLLEKMSSIQNEWRDVQSEMKKLQKDIVKQMKESSKTIKKKAVKVSNVDKPKRNPSGFAKPAALSKELCDFLKQPYGTEMARTDVTKFLTKYIKEHSLQQESDKRIIKPDAPLFKLLGLTKDSEEITYFNLQKYMKPHFPKAVVVVA